MRRRYQRQKPQLSAAEINQWNDVARRVKRGEFDQRRVPQEAPTEKPDRISGEWVWIRNNTDRDFQRYEVGSLGEWSPAVRDDAVVFDFAVENMWRPNVVCLEDIPRDEIGRAQIAGVTLARFGRPAVVSQMNMPQVVFLESSRNRFTFEESTIQASGGSARLLHEHNNIGIALVQLGVEHPAAAVVSWTPANATGGVFFDSTASDAGSTLGAAGNIGLPRYSGVSILEHPSNANWDVLRIARPGFYRIGVNTRMPGGTLQDYAIEPKLELVSGSARYVTHLQGRSYAEQCTAHGGGPAHWEPHDHYVEHYWHLSEDAQIMLRAIGNVDTITTKTGDANNYISLELICPAQPSVDSGDHLDNNPWQYNPNQQAL